MDFRSQASIKRKQMTIIMLTSCVTLLLACTAFVAYELHTFRAELKRHLVGLADRIVDQKVILAPGNSSSRETAAVINSHLNSILEAEQNVIVAILYDHEGKGIGKYRRADQTGHFVTPSAPRKVGFNFTSDRLSMTRAVQFDGQSGLLYVESDLKTMHERLLRYAGIVFAVLILSFVVALVLSSRLQRVISDPIIHVAQVARIVSHKKNYAIRAVKQGEDELGTLVDGFNEMLEQIQVRDAELQKGRDELEKRVDERTRDLLSEIGERSRAEKGLQQQFTRISLLNQITHSIAERMDLMSVLNIVLKQLEDHLPTDFGTVFVTNSTNDFVVSAVRSVKKLPPEAAFRLVPNSVMTVPQTGLEDCLEKQLVLISDISGKSTPLLYLLSRCDMKAIVAVPMLVEEKLFGVLLVARRTADSFSNGECEFLRMLSEQVALAAHQTRLHTELQGAYNELRQTQQAVMQQQRLQALGQMASGIAHDINNALSPIIVYSELVLRNEPYLGESSRRHLNNIKTAGEDIAQIVARMREFYRRREDTEQLVTINLNQLSEQVTELTRPRWRDIPQQKGTVVNLSLELDPAVPEIYGNASEVREALTNLILNAVDAMPTGGTLSLRSHFTPAGPDHKSPAHVLLEVCDTGLGMDEETRRRCLEPFFSTKGQRGTGLGLAMVYGIMERHEGTIEIHSEMGKGTAMRLIFPLREMANMHDTTVFTKAAVVSPLRILCIDDEPLLRQLMKEILESDGHNVTVVDGGKAGLEVFRANRGNGDGFDVVITDLGMPYVDGRQVASILKKESPLTPVILLTGWGTMMKADGEVPSQVDAVVSKPPRISELRETLLRVTTPSS